jgi:hypothetical protein
MYVEIIPPASPVRTESPGPQERLTMAFVVFARYRVRAGAEARVANALRNMVAPTRSEPGNLDYQVFRDPTWSPSRTDRELREDLVADGEPLGFAKRRP